MPERPDAMSHELFVAAAYGISALGILGLVAWNLIDQRARKAELADLEARGVRRRSDRAATDGR
jgi:heme exporter protein D